MCPIEPIEPKFALDTLQTGAADGLACADTGRPETLQMVYNLFSLAERENTFDQLFSRARELDFGLIAREPLANGLGDIVK